MTRFSDEYTMSHVPDLDDAWEAEDAAVTLTHEIGHLLGAQHH